VGSGDPSEKDQEGFPITAVGNDQEERFSITNVGHDGDGNGFPINDVGKGEEEKSSFAGMERGGAFYFFQQGTGSIFIRRCLRSHMKNSYWKL